MALPRPLLGFLGVPRPSAPRGLWVLGLEGSQSPAQPIQRGLNHSFLNRKQQRPQSYTFYCWGTISQPNGTLN